MIALPDLIRIRNGWLYPREAAIRVKGCMIALPDLIRIRNGRLDPREAAIRVRCEAACLLFLTFIDFSDGRLDAREASIRVKVRLQTCSS